MAVTTTTIDYLLKKVYTPRAIEEAVYKDNPLLALMPKAGGFTGSSHIHAIRHRDTLARSPDFATAQTGSAGAAGVTKGCQFIVTRVKNYQLYNLETEAILAGRDDKGSFLRTLTTEVDAALNNVARDVAKDIYRSGLGERGVVSLVSGAGPFVFTVGDHVANFEVGMTITTAATLTGALRNAGGGVVLTQVDRSAGTITAATNPDTITAGDFLFEKGDRGTGASPAPLKIAGLEAWNPVSVATSGDSLFGVDRYAQGDLSRVSGLRNDVSAMNPEEAFATSLALAAREAASPHMFFSSFTDVKNVQVALGSKAVVEYMDVGGLGFRSIRATGPKGDVQLIADQNAPPGIGRFLTPSTWELKYAGELFNTLDLDGASLSRVYNADQFEGRIAMYGNMVCYAPGQNLRSVLPT